MATPTTRSKTEFQLLEQCQLQPEEASKPVLTSFNLDWSLGCGQTLLPWLLCTLWSAYVQQALALRSFCW